MPYIGHWGLKQGQDVSTALKKWSGLLLDFISKLLEANNVIQELRISYCDGGDSKRI